MKKKQAKKQKLKGDQPDLEPMPSVDQLTESNMLETNHVEINSGTWFDGFIRGDYHIYTEEFNRIAELQRRFRQSPAWKRKDYNKQLQA